MARIARKHASLVVLTALVVGLMAFSPTPASAKPIARTGVYAFPSSASTVVASVGFIDDDEVGYFWSAARGDRVSQTFSGPAVITGAVLKVTVVTNVLNSGAEVDWNLEINSIVVGKFRVVEGFTGTISLAKMFAPISGPNYDVTIRVTNEVQSGEGSHTLAYAGAWLHGIQFCTR